METIADLLSRLRSLGIEIRLEDGRLRYRAQKGVLTPDLQQVLRSRKDEAIAFLRRVQEVAPRVPLPLPSRVLRSGPLPLSYAQERLWFLDQLEPNSASYNLPAVFRLSGDLDADALEQSLQEIGKRHEVLRTRFASAEGHPVQVIESELPLPVRRIDLRHLLAEAQDDARRRIGEEEGRKPFDLAVGPLARATLVRLGDADHELRLTMHHIISDAWSQRMIPDELGTLYSALVHGDTPPLPELPIQYADYSSWQRQWLRGEWLASQMAYWKGRLAGAPPMLDLPLDHPRPPRQTYPGAQERFSLPRELAAGIQDLSRRREATPYMVFLAALQGLLGRLCDQDDVLVTSSISGRNWREVEPLIGLFVNLLVIRTSLAGDPSFRELLSRVRETSLESFDAQDLPFEKLVEELEPERMLSHEPLAQVLFVFQNLPTRSTRAGKIRISAPSYDWQATRLDLEFYVWEVDGQYHGTVVYNTDLFEKATIRRLVQQLRLTLGAVVADDGLRLSQWPLLTDSERHQMLVEWNATQADFPDRSCLHELFEIQVRAAPDAIALLDEGRPTTYAELNRRANQVAHCLRKLGVGTEVLVGIAVERSPEMVAGLLGILKAGGAYLPLDPSFPGDRLTYMLNDSRPAVLVTLERHLPLLAQPGLRSVCLDSDWAAIANEPDEDLLCGVGPNDLAYVLYTSGSVGGPKGIQATHRATVNRLAWMWNQVPFDKDEICCHKTAQSFGDSVWEVFGPLLGGIPAVIVADDVVRDADRLVECLDRYGVTRIVLVPSLLRTLLDCHSDLGSRLPALRTWSVSGESLPLELCRRFLATLPGARLLNLYGTAEVAADVTWYDCAEISPVMARVPIGRPIANTQIYLLDRHMNPVPVGVTGELHVGGVGLSRGYLNRPALTEEKFVPNPFSREPGARLFKTGDLARFLPDGTLDLIGRSDDQVKIRGFRIELGEIEWVLAQHPSVESSVAAIQDGPDDSRCLVAYVVPRPGTSLDEEAVRQFLRSQLPAYMVPAGIVLLDRLPLTASGKIHRTGLPPPAWACSKLEPLTTAPRTDLEKQLTAIWREVLGLEKVGVGDNFFELGGHSLLATQLVSRIRRTFQIRLPLRAIFEAPTVAELAALIEHVPRTEPTGAAVPISPQGRDAFGRDRNSPPEGKRSLRPDPNEQPHGGIGS